MDQLPIECSAEGGDNRNERQKFPSCVLPGQTGLEAKNLENHRRKKLEEKRLKVGYIRQIHKHENLTICGCFFFLPYIQPWIQALTDWDTTWIIYMLKNIWQHHVYTKYKAYWDLLIFNTVKNSLHHNLIKIHVGSNQI